MSSFSFIHKNKPKPAPAEVTNTNETLFNQPQTQQQANKQEKKGFAFIKKNKQPSVSESNNDHQINLNNINTNDSNTNKITSDNTSLPKQKDNQDIFDLLGQNIPIEPINNNISKKNNSNNEIVNINLNAEKDMIKNTMLDDKSDSTNPSVEINSKKSGFSFLKKKKKDKVISPPDSYVSDKLPKLNEHEPINEQKNDDLILNNSETTHSNKGNNTAENEDENGYTKLQRKVTREELMSDELKEKEEKKKKENEFINNLTPENIRNNYKIKNEEYKSEYLKHISELHNIKLSLKAKKVQLENICEDKQGILKDQQQAIEKNDFERAELIENKINKINEEEQDLQKTIDQKISNLLESKKKELEIFRIFSNNASNAKKQFLILKTNISTKKDNFNNNEMIKHKSENIRLQKLNEKLNFLKSNLDTEKNALETEEVKINELIKGQSAGIFEQLETLNTEKKALNDEILRLQKELEQKELEMDKLNGKIESKEIEIDAIKSNFSFEFSKIEIKKKNYNENLIDFQEQTKTYHKELEDFNKEEINYNKYINELNDKIKDYDAEIDKNKIIFDDNEKLLSKKEVLMNNENKAYSDILLNNKKIDELKNDIENHKVRIQKLKVNNKLLQSEIDQIEIKLPALEEEKKEFVKVKNFKEAGRISKELKASLERQNQCKNSLEDNKKQIESLDKELTNFEDNINDLKAKGVVLKQNLDICKYQSLEENLNSMLKFSDESENKNSDLLEEIQLVRQQISKLKGLEHIIKFLETNKDNKDNKENGKCESFSGNNLNDKDKSNKNNNTDDLMNLLGNSQLNENNLMNNINISNNNNEQTNELSSLDNKISIVKDEDKEKINLKIEELNKQIQEAVKKDDYDLADKLQTELNELSAKIN